MGLQTIEDCWTVCHEDSACKYFAHNVDSQYCLMFTANLRNEPITRLIAEGWRYGRINPNGNKVRLPVT